MALRKNSGPISVYCDGGIGDKRQATGLGVVIRDARNEIIGLVKRGMPPMTNNEAEYAALVLALQSVQSFRPPVLQVYMDSEVVIGQMTGRFAVHSATLKRWHTQACQLTRQFKQVTFSHIPRDLNRLADALANEALTEAREVRSRE